MFAFWAWVMAVGGGVWGVGVSVVLLVGLGFDALFFLILLLLIHATVLLMAFWRNAKSLWRGSVWTVAGGVLLCFVYLSRFSLGIYLVPSASLILVAGIISIMSDLVPAMWKEQSRMDSFKLGEIIQTRSGQFDPRLRKLTPRELEVLLLIADGKSNQEIADALVISPNTVRHHVHHILRKLNCSSRGEAAVIAKISGLSASDKI